MTTGTEPRMLAALLSTTVAVGIAWLLRKFLMARQTADVPYIEFYERNTMTRYLSDTRNLMRRGYKHYTREGKPFAMLNQIDLARPLVNLSLKYLKEVRSAPYSQLSFPLSVAKSTVVNEIGGPIMTDEAIKVVRLAVNRSLTELIPHMQEQCLVAYKELMPDCQDWTPIVTFPLLLKIFIRITARLFIGSELCNNHEWLDLVIDFTNAVFKASYSVRARYRPYTRWLANYFDPDVKQVYKLRYKAGELLCPVLEARKAGEGEYADGVQWLWDEYHGSGKELTPDKLALDEFIIIIASIHSSAATALSILYDLINHPHSLAEIRTEVEQVKREHGAWTRHSLAALRVLDSFMKESQRVHTLQQLTLQRIAVKPFTFNDGLHLPAGTQISLPNELISKDPDFWGPNAAQFDPKRFLHKREGEDANNSHFASVSDDMLPFGSGTHTCPGRFLAQDVTKLMFVHLLTNYDIEYSEGVVGRPADVVRHHNVMPDTSVVLLFWKREGLDGAVSWSDQRRVHIAMEIMGSSHTLHLSDF
ncbi:cytochrome P450 [Bombardia bombarda]|uniref:Cytochrome P450 n=1 Tax=Bombardia bombarda TaxID=252184 RepID=A0AA40C201_9PEZI|nr:cytochrome P450 [Bombardia bombarda]